MDCLRKISIEINQNIDKHSKTLIVSNLELFLNYCMRFYDRQFITRAHANNDILARFEALLDDYFKTGKNQMLGLPTVAYCAEKLNLPPNYYGLIRKETGTTALDTLQSRVIEEAKLKISEGNKSISEIAYQLAFKYNDILPDFLNKRPVSRRTSIDIRIENSFLCFSKCERNNDLASIWLNFPYSKGLRNAERSI